jgi:hypothetical protein
LDHARQPQDHAALRLRASPGWPLPEQLSLGQILRQAFYRLPSVTD